MFRVTIRNITVHSDIRSLDIQNLEFAEVSDDTPECGVFEDYPSGRVGIVNTRLCEGLEAEPFFFISDRRFDFGDGSLASSHTYTNKDTGVFKLFRDGEELLEFVYPREPNKDYGGWLVGTWETEEEKDLLVRIHKSLNN